MRKLTEIVDKIPPSGERALKLLGFWLLLFLSGWAFVGVAKFIVPFIVAFVIASILNPLVNRLEQWRIPRGASAMVLLLLVAGLLGTGLGLGIARLVSEITHLAGRLPAYYSQVLDTVQTGMKELQGYTHLIDADVMALINRVLNEIYRFLLSLIQPVTAGMINTATALPGVMIFFTVSMVATFFITRDRVRLLGQAQRMMPESWSARIGEVKTGAFTALFGYLNATLILMGITFMLLLVGFSVLRIDYAFILAVLIALADALPIVGTGTFLVPWAVITMVRGELTTGVGIAILYGIIWIIRQMMEPRVLGKQIGVYPLYTLFALYLGMRVVGGVLGAVSGPVVFILVRNITYMFTGGRTIRQYIYNLPPDEKPPEVRKLEKVKTKWTVRGPKKR